MERRSDHYDGAFGFEAGEQIGAIPVPQVGARDDGVGFHPPADGVIDDDEVGAESGDGSARADGAEAAIVGRFPIAFGVVAQRIAEHVAVVADVALNIGAAGFG